LGTISVFGFSTEMNQLNSDGSAKVFGGKWQPQQDSKGKLDKIG
jgi:hypothetical protein